MLVVLSVRDVRASELEATWQGERAAPRTFTSHWDETEDAPSSVT